MMIIDKNEITIYDAESFHKQLLKEISKDSIIIDMKNVYKIDMSIIQLFISAKKSSELSEKTFKLSNVNSEVKDIIKNASCQFLLGETNG